MMRKNRLYFGVVAVLLLGALSWRTWGGARPASSAQEPRLGAATPAQTKLVKAAITAQLDAFKRDDYASAEKYQSAGLRAHFGSTAAFRKAIKAAYPQFASYRRVRFAPMKADKTGALVFAPVTVSGSDGVDVVALYIMVREKAGFRVEGVQTAPDRVPGPHSAPAPHSAPGEASPGVVA